MQKYRREKSQKNQKEVKIGRQQFVASNRASVGNIPIPSK